MGKRVLADRERLAIESILEAAENSCSKGSFLHNIDELDARCKAIWSDWEYAILPFRRTQDAKEKPHISPIVSEFASGSESTATFQDTSYGQKIPARPSSSTRKPHVNIETQVSTNTNPVSTDSDDSEQDTDPNPPSPAPSKIDISHSRFDTKISEQSDIKDTLLSEETPTQLQTFENKPQKAKRSPSLASERATSQRRRFDTSISTTNTRGPGSGKSTRERTSSVNSRNTSQMSVSSSRPKSKNTSFQSSKSRAKRQKLEETESQQSVTVLPNPAPPSHSKISTKTVSSKPKSVPNASCDETELRSIPGRETPIRRETNTSIHLDPDPNIKSDDVTRSQKKSEEVSESNPLDDPVFAIMSRRNEEEPFNCRESDSESSETEMTEESRANELTDVVARLKMCLDAAPKGNRPTGRARRSGRKRKTEQIQPFSRSDAARLRQENIALKSQVSRLLNALDRSEVEIKRLKGELQRQKQDNAKQQAVIAYLKEQKLYGRH